MNDMNLYAVIAITILGGTGLAVLFFGALFATAGAFGHGRKVWGILSLISLPMCFIFSFIYCVVYREETRYQRKYLLTGLLLVGLAFAATSFL